MSLADNLQATLLELGLNRPLAHRVLFAHRHVSSRGNPVESPPFHDEMAEDWAGPHPLIIDMVFRGGAKSTIGEESTTIGALYADFKYALIIGASQSKAVERLTAIRNELKTNEDIQLLYGRQAALETDTDTEIVTAAGVKVQALGRGQSMRGLKHHDRRPDFVWIDDLEDDKDVATPEARAKVWSWLTKVILPGMDPGGRVRLSATPLHPDSVPERLTRDPLAKVRRIPIYYKDLETGEEVSSWPARFSIGYIKFMEKRYRERGELENFKQEYMVQAESPENKPFRRDMIHVFPQVKTWQAAYSMTDPARTAKATSATTGHAVWSWINDKLVIWDGWARRLLPDQIIASIFDSHDTYKTVWCGVEEDGLNEFLLQPLRQEMIRRGEALPLKPVKAPVGKLQFIRGLQPFFQAKEVQFAKPMPDLEEQLLGFPTGDIDAPNALAYALKLRPGMPLYEDFGPRHIEEDLRPAPGRPIWICLNAGRGLVTAVVAQTIDGVIRVFGDMVREGDPGAVVQDMITSLRMEMGVMNLRYVVGPRHYDRFNNVGLVQALKAVPVEVRSGGDIVKGRAIIRRLLQRERQARAMILVGGEARWTLGGFTGGYARARLKGGLLSDDAEDGQYRVLMEGLETFAGMMDVSSTGGEDDARQYATTSDGRRYVTMLGARGGRR